jgi:hypothetical protein
MIKLINCDWSGAGWGPSYTHIHSGTMEKVASSYIPTDLRVWIEKLTPRPEGRYVLLNALGAHEYWGPNANGDTFPEWSLKGLPPPADVKEFLKTEVNKVIPDFTEPPSYGGPSFVTNAKVYQNHINKDPTIACGDVIAQAYNDQMHRVELIVFIYEQRAPDVVRMIDAGDPVPWSMGAKLRFDVCSICSKVSKTRAEYCPHLATQLRQILPDGRKVFSYNYFPVFFDISKVSMPADRSAWMLKKVASVGEPKEASMEKRELVSTAPVDQKDLGSTPINPDLIKFISNNGGCQDDSVAVDPQMIAMKKEFSLPEILKNMLMVGMLPSEKDLNYLSDGDPSRIPGNLDLVNPNRRLILLLSSKIPERSLLDPHFTKRAARGQTRPLKVSNSPFMQKLAHLLGNIDYTRLVQMIETNPTIQLAVQPNAVESSLFKTASQSKAATWLPFVVVCSQFNGETK